MRSNERGQAIVELAFALPIILLLLLVLVDVGLAIDRRIVLQHAVRDGVRLASVATDPVDVIARTEDQSQGLLDAGDITVCYIDGPDPNASVGDVTDSVRVQGSYTYSFDTLSGGLLNAIGIPPPSVEMTPKAEFALEASVSGATAC